MVFSLRVGTGHPWPHLFALPRLMLSFLIFLASSHPESEALKS